MNELSDHIVSAPVVVLTGAGASVALGKPTTVSFMERLGSHVPDDYREVWHWLVATCRDRWNTDTPDVEMILEHTRAVLEGAGTMRQDYNLSRHLDDAAPVLDRYDRIASWVCGLVVEEYSDVDPAEAAALYQPLFARLQSESGAQPLPIFTLNYDVAVERATSELGVRLVDGIRRGPPTDNRWSPSEFHAYVPGKQATVVLFKLHGSTTWAWDSRGSLVELPLGTGKDPGELTHAVLYPYLTQKSLEREPFKTGYAYLRASLAKAHSLVIIGTSLRDYHLVQILREAVVANRELDVVLLDPSLGHERLVEILGISVREGVTIEAEFSPKTSADLPNFVLASLPPKRRRRKAAGARFGLLP